MADSSPSTTKICPTCGTRLADNASRCLVCGTELTASAEIKQPAAVQANRMPEITLSLPLALGLLAVFIALGAALVFIFLKVTGANPAASAANVTATPSLTPTLTATPTEFFTSTPVPSDTPEPPIEYTVASGDTCTSIALAFNVSTQSIIILNNLPVACNTLVIGQKLKVPHPTPTPLPQATNTLEPAAATLQACDKVYYTVQANDTLSSIAANYAVPMDAIKAYNGLSTDQVYLDMKIIIPLCERAATPGPSPTPTIPPPYPPANLLLPPDGASFTLANDSIILQWASLGTLRDNESYQVTVEDVTDPEGRRLTEYVTDTKFIVPSSFRPKDNTPHVFRWWVTVVRQNGSDDQGQPIWVSGGEKSAQRVFSWQGVAPESTPQP